MIQNLLLIILLLEVVYIIWLLRNTGKDDLNESDEDRVNGIMNDIDVSKLIMYCDFLLNFPLTQKTTNQLLEYTAEIVNFSDMEGRTEIAKTVLLTDILAFTLVTTTLIISDFNLLLTISVFIVALLIKKNYTIKKFKRLRNNYHRDLLYTLRSLEVTYKTTNGNLIQSLENCRITELTDLYIKNILYMIKESGDSTKALANFNLNNRHNISLRFTALCYHTYISGDYKDKVTGESHFSIELEKIVDSLDHNNYFADEEQRKFSIMENLPILSIGITFLLPYMITKTNPSLKFYYQTPLGYLSFIIAIILGVVAFNHATKLNMHETLNNDRTFLESLYFENTYRARKWDNRLSKKRYDIYQEKINRSLSQLTPAMFLFRKTVFTLTFGASILALIFFYIVSQSILYKYNYIDLPDSVIQEISKTAPDFDKIQEVFFEDNNYITVDDLKALYQENNYYTTENNYNLMVDQINLNKDKINAVEFKWQYLIFVYIAGIIGWFIPDRMFKKREKLLDEVSKEELITFYSLVSIARTSTWKIQDYLHYLSANSQIYKHLLAQNFLNSYNHPEEIYKSVNNIKYSLYKSFLDRIASTHQVVKPIDAFKSYESDLIKMENRYRQSVSEKMQKNEDTLFRIIMFSIYTAAILRMLLPYGLYTYNIMKAADMF